MSNKLETKTGLERSDLKRVPRTIWMLGFTSLFADISTEIIQAVLPIFLVSVLGVDALTVGLIDGLGEATASVTKVFSGGLSDYLGKRKWLAVGGYGLAALTSPMFPLANSWWNVLTARLIERTGKGVRVAPRDALVADCVHPSIRGTAYGLRQGLDSLGALAGPLIAAVVLSLFADSLRLALWIACIPASISVLVLILGVQEPSIPHSAKRRSFPLRKSELKRLGSSFWLLMIVVGLLLLGRFSQSFVLLRAQNLEFSIASIPLVLAAINLVAAPISLKSGQLSDRIGRRGLIGIGFCVLTLAQLVLAISTNSEMIFLGAVLWGVHLGMTQGVLAALITDIVPNDLRGTAFGVFHLITGVVVLISSTMAGWLWDSFGTSVPFASASAIGVVGLIAFWIFSRRILRAN